MGCPGFMVLDEDAGEYHKIKLDCPTDGGVFAYQKKDGCIYMRREWDLDSKGLSSETITCTVTAKDRGNLTATTTVIYYY